MQSNANPTAQQAALAQRIDELITQMTLEEKVAQMLFTAPAIERLGIPAYNWWNEAYTAWAEPAWPPFSPGHRAGRDLE